MINYVRRIALNLLCSAATASAYGTILPNQEPTTFIHDSYYKALAATRIEDKIAEADAKFFFAANNGSITVQAGIDARIKHVRATVYATTTYRSSDNAEVITPHAKLEVDLNDRTKLVASMNTGKSAYSRLPSERFYFAASHMF